MTYVYKITGLLVPLMCALVLFGCTEAQDKPMPTTAVGHDHAAMQAGQRDAVPNADATQSYTCPMHPHYISDDPDGSCPICGMDLVPAVGGTSRADISFNGIHVSSDMIQTMGVRTVLVGVSDFSDRLRAFGLIEPNARLESVAASRLEGWINGLTVRANGDIVRPEQRLYSIYSPDLIAAQKDYLASLTIGNERRIMAVRQRLKSKGLQDRLITRLSETRSLIERVPVYAESKGVVTDLMVRDGDYLKPGDPVLRLQAYDEVWVMAQVPASDLSRVSIGMAANLSFESTPDAPRTGTVDYIYPTIEPRTRTAKVRIAVANPAGDLRPGAYVDIVFETIEAGLDQSRLSVPAQAILRDSRGAHVIVALGEGRFVSRDVLTGASVRGRTEIIQGLTSGELIVASGQFMLDSEANLRAGLSKLSSPALQYTPSTPLSELPIDAQTLSQVDHMVDAALYFHEAIIDGYAVEPSFLDPTLQLIDRLDLRYANSRLSPVLADARAATLQAKIAPSSDALADPLAALMTALGPWLLQGAPAHYDAKGLRFFRDPDSGREWLQRPGQPANPYSDATAREISWSTPMADTTP